MSRSCGRGSGYYRRAPRTQAIVATATGCLPRVVDGTWLTPVGSHAMHPPHDGLDEGRVVCTRRAAVARGGICGSSGTSGFQGRPWSWPSLCGGIRFTAPGDEAIPITWTGLASWLSTDGGASWRQTGSTLHGTAPDLYPSSIPDLYAMSGGFIGVGPNAQGNLAVWTSADGTKWQPATIDATSEEFGRSLAVSGSRAIIGGRTVGTGMGGDRAVFWTGEVGTASLAAPLILP
jgi:hypothetical protein